MPQSHGQHSPCLELPPKCTFSVVSLSCEARDSRGSTTHTGAARGCSPSAEDPGVAETLAGMYWHLAGEGEGFWPGPGLLQGTSHETYIIERTLLNKVLAGRRARSCYVCSAPLPQGTISGRSQASTQRWELPHPLLLAPSWAQAQSWERAQGQGKAATEVPGHKQCRSENRK